MWFWLLSAIAGSIIGGATDSWFRETKLGIWFYKKMDQFYTWANHRYGLKMLTDEEKRLKKFPHLKKRLTESEAKLDELDKLVRKEREKRITELEIKLDELDKRVKE
jgi:hypothetical protein